MATRIGDYVIGGEIYGGRKNCVLGWIEFSPGWGFRLEVGGNLSGELAGRDFRFKVREESRTEPQLLPGEFPDLIEGFDNQIGVIGDVVFQVRKVPTVPMDEFMEISKSGGELPVAEKDCLYLEWYGQSGRVVAEVIDVELEFIDEDEPEADPPEALPLPDESDFGDGPEITIVGEDGSVERVSDSPDEATDDDPYGLFDPDMEQAIQHSLEADDADAGPAEKGQPRSWSEVIPGIDPETEALYEQWDEVLHGPQELATSLFDSIQLPPVASVISDEQAWPLVAAIMGRLATCSVAFDMCEHATPLTAYRCLMEDVLPIAKVSPLAGASKCVVHYSMWEYCPECAAEME